MKILDLFSGIGGFSLGLERAGMKTVAFCEVDPACRQVLKKHWPHVPIFEDVKTLTSKDIHDTVDVICGGFPCQDISVAGRGAGLAGERSGLWYEYHRLIEEIRPRYVIIENVAALRSRGLDAVLGGLAALGYDAEWHCIPASAVGAPHQRDRVWVVAYPNYDGRYGAKNGQSDLSGNDRSTAWAEESVELARSSDVGQNFRRSAAETMADSDKPRSQGRLSWWANKERQSELGYLGRCCSVDGQPIENWWAVEPSVGRVANGVSGRTHRLRQLGNAVVPQIPELIGRAIIAYENTLG
jgi:DNA (cytosine-5)-methyltransferase 1